MSWTDGFEPYAWQLAVTGERTPDGVPYSGYDVGTDAYEDETVRAAMESRAREAFANQHPGVAIKSVRWYPLIDFGGDDQ